MVRRKQTDRETTDLSSFSNVTVSRRKLLTIENRLLISYWFCMFFTNKNIILNVIKQENSIMVYIIVAMPPLNDSRSMVVLQSTYSFLSPQLIIRHQNDSSYSHVCTPRIIVSYNCTPTSLVLMLLSSLWYLFLDLPPNCQTFPYSWLLLYSNVGEGLTPSFDFVHPIPGGKYCVFASASAQ